MSGTSAAHSGLEASPASSGNVGAGSAALRDWASAVLPGIAVSIAAQPDPAESQGVLIRLASITPRVVPLTPGRKSAALALDYLVTVHLDDPIAAHSALAELAFAAVVEDSYEIVTGQSVFALCRAMGAKPAPGLILRTELQRDTRLPQAPLVREAPKPALEPLVQAHGRVLGPGNLPIAGALVSIEGSSRCCTTGPDGRFRFAIPAGQPATVTARARSRVVSASLAPETETILTLQMEA